MKYLWNKHFNIKYHFINEKYNENEIELFHYTKKKKN